jgi:hypothetical protein
MTNILLTGAGFTRNWGGLLGNEAFEYFLGSPEITDDIRMELWADKNKGDNYEVTLARLQVAAPKDATGTVQAQVNTMTSALVGMFKLMEKGLAAVPFERNRHVDEKVATFLQKFDAIFTLNQDLLLERYYHKGIELVGDRRFNGAGSPCLKIRGGTPSGHDPDYTITAERVAVDSHGFSVPARYQPYFKLHGSMNWIDAKGGRLLVMGGNKTSAIGSSPLLNWYAEQFVQHLHQRDARLMIIGYGFGDEHINQVLLQAAKAGLKIFLIDPLGVDMLDRRSKLGIPGPPTELMGLQPNIIGASRRDLLSTFGGDSVEHVRVMQFFNRT